MLTNDNIVKSKMPGLKSIVKNSSWMAAEQAIRMAGGLFVGISIARHLGPSKYGALSFALALSSMIGIFASLGLTRTIVRELTLHGHEDVFARRILASTLAWRLIFSFLCYSTTVAISVIFGQGDPILVSIVATTVAFSSFDVIDLYFQSKTASHLSVIARSLNFFIFIVIKVGLLINNGTLIDFAIVTTLEAIGSASSLWLTNRSYGLNISLEDIDLTYGWRLISYSWPELFAGFACLIFMRIDQIMIGNLLGDKAVGQYAIASRLAEAWYFIPGALVASSFPAIIRQRAIDKKLYMKRIQQLMVTLVGISYIAAIVVMLLAPLGIGLLFGPIYSDSVPILVILVWSGLFVSLGTASGSWIMAEGKPMLNLTRNMMGATSNIAFNFYLIPRLGTSGAAVGTLLSLSLAYLFSDFINPQTRHLGYIKIKALLLIWK